MRSALRMNQGNEKFVLCLKSSKKDYIGNPSVDRGVIFKRI